MNKLDIQRLTTYQWSLLYDGFLLGHIIADPFSDISYSVSIVDGYSCRVDTGFWSAILKAEDECGYIIDRLREELTYINESDIDCIFKRQSIYEIDIMFGGHILGKLLYDNANRNYVVYVGPYFEYVLCTFDDLYNVNPQLHTYLSSAKSRFTSEDTIIDMRLN